MNILLAGEGGQGVQTVAKIIASAAKKSEKHVTYLPSFGVEQRGGVSLAFVKIQPTPISYPRFKNADIVVAFCNRSIESIEDFLKENSSLIYDDSTIENEKLDLIRNKINRFIKISAQKIAQEKYSIKSANMLLLGALSAKLSEIDPRNVENEILAEFKDKIAEKPQIKDLNIRAFREGLDLAKNFRQDTLSGKVEKEIKTEFSDDQKTWIRFPEYCKSCGLCLIRCPVKALKFSENNGFLGNPLPIVEINKCIACGKCMEICPDGAIEVKKNESK